MEDLSTYWELLKENIKLELPHALESLQPILQQVEQQMKSPGPDLVTSLNELEDFLEILLIDSNR
ncbi:hypothetical protein [Candidatus Uabimicrobium amorphum]|uniref:Uncharacterized protein n=1 Tax=Uabimicrobium amorphum TaxID=2596890 RepID=A0A5S9IT58_UABAM|nr:hypothetical protein [Candidatus Uabimicrobium amorphum]BBM86670.1 hypothetical protein UABAM_05056 [Candidatus Uabimicrobium amorphum]